MEVVDTLENFNPRDSFFSEMGIRIKNANISGIFTGIEIIPHARQFSSETTEEVVVIGKADTDHLSQDEIFQHAEFFAADIIKHAPAGLFYNQERFEEKNRELTMRKEAVATLPVFTIEKVPADIRDLYMKSIFEKEWLKDLFLNDRESYDDLERRHIHLAWLFENDLMIIDEQFTAPVEGVDFDIDYFLDAFDGRNLFDIYSDFNLQDKGTLLKGLFFGDKSLSDSPS